MRAMSSVTAVFEKMSPWFLTERLKQRASYFRLALLGLSVILSVYLGFATRFDAAIPGIWLHALPTIALIWALVTTACFAAVRAHRSFWGFLSVGEMLQLILVTLLGSAISAGLVSLFTDLYVPRSVDLLIAIYSTIAVAGGRFVLLCIFESAVGRVKSKGRERVLILGADATGVGILFQVQRHCPERKPIGFVDAKPEFSGAQICGLPVFGAPDIPGLKSKHRVKELLVSSSNLITSAAEKRILSACQDAEIRVRSVALISDEFINRGAEAAKELSIERLLGRESVCFQNTKVTRAISGRVMMVTGAAGSIGSEICRQLAKHGPAAIVGYEVNETALFYLEREMRRSYPDVPFIPCIGSVQNASRLAEVLCTSKPAMVFHAAAYKHVPLMEQHLSEAIENNIFGTDNLLTACANHGVSTFVMLSTDKAVRPTNMMGVTKRIAELIVRSSPSSTMTCVSVRFGNVLGSNGSVIPVFHSQIERGGPVTVTHPDMTRYFMTIPEAAQLVLEASSLGRRNEIYILDMGEPVKIVDLARRMIQWKGLKVGEEIKIEFSGIRPGEKLSEELQGLGEQTAPTQHSKIAVLIGSSMPNFELRNELNALRIATQSRDFKRILSIIQRLVPDYVPSTELLAHVENLNPENAAFYADEAA
jgi:FlaA1/EpsC-like NDP-sugar epimerase